MPSRETQITGFAPYQTPEVVRPAPAGDEVIGAAFALENDVLNAWELLNRPAFKADPLFNLTQSLKDTKYWENYRENFIGVKSQEELNFIASQIDTEEHQRDVLARSGWSGTVAMIGAGMLSPTVALPLLGPSRGIRGVGEALLLGGVAGVAQEVPLQANQQTRTPAETAFSIGASTVLGGILGGAVSVLRPGEKALLEAGMVNQPGGIAISRAGDVGAKEVVMGEAGNLAPGAQTLAKITDSNTLTRSPVTDTIMSDFNIGRGMMSEMSDGGLKMERNALGVPTSAGGTVENRVHTWYGNFAEYVTKADEAYRDYIFDGAAPSVAPNLRATMRGALSVDKLSRDEFKEQIWWALAKDGEHENAHVKAAATAVRKYIDDPILKGMQETKLLGEELPDTASQGYVKWLFDHGVIRQDPVKFVDFLAKKYNEKMQEEFSVMYQKFLERQNQSEELVSDMKRGPDEIEVLRNEYGAKLKALDEDANVEHLTALEDTIASLRAAMRPLKGGNIYDEATRKQMSADARAMADAAGEPFIKFKTARRELKRRLSNLNKSYAVIEARREAKLERISRIEELGMNTLMRVARAGKRFLSKLDTLSDEAFDKEVSKIKDDFARAGDVYDRGQERLTKIIAGEKTEDDFWGVDGTASEQLLNAEALQTQRAGRLTEISQILEHAEELDRAEIRALVEEGLTEALARAKLINDKRAVRSMKLRDAVKKLDPKLVDERIAAVLEKDRARASAFGDKVREMGGSLDDSKGTADFTSYAREAAQRTKDKIQGTTLRLPVVDIIQGERGSALPRLLGFIPTEEMAPWLEKDIEKVIRTQLRTMAPDIEMSRKFGSVNAEEQWVKLTDELNKKLDDVKAAVDSKGKPRDAVWKAKETARIQDEYDRVKVNLEGVMKRLRHQWGLPSDPNGMGYRMAKTVGHLNVLRYMGGVVLSSIPDIARPVMRYGLTRTFKDGYLPMVTNLKGFKMNMKEARRASVAIDALTNARAHALLDITDDLGRGSKFERAVEYASSRHGITALFNYWTDGMKQISSAVSNAKLLDSVAEVVGDPQALEKVASGTANKSLRESIDFLASNGIDANIAADIWREVQKGGGGKIDGVWLPNTEDWTNPRAVEAFRQAVAREANISIITPGVERPLWLDRTMMGKLLGQFKSFAFSSTQKTLMAGLQQRDMAFVTGVTFSLALGALSYYLRSVAKGGAAEERMRNADISEWADQSFALSGIAGVFGLGQDLLSRIPATANAVTLSGQRTITRGGDNLVEALLGPSFDAMKTSADILAGIHDPTKSTAHDARLLLPLQNMTFISRLFDAIENAIPVKETRQ
jgi:hypothetical protein